MRKLQTISRREFLCRSALFGTGLTLAIRPIKASSVLGANDRVRVGVIGLGIRGCQHIDYYQSLPNVEIAAVCDLRENFLHRTVSNLQKAGTKSVVKEKDYRRILDMTNLDAVSIAVPRRLRASLAIDAIQAGKDALIEKPFSSTVSEGKRLAAAVNQYQRIVQQRDENFFIPASDLFGVGDFHIIGGIKQIKSSKIISSPPQKGNEVSALPELALDELDVARCLLDVSAPTKVSAIGFSQKTINPLSKITTQLEFNHENGEKRHIQLEVQTSFERTSHRKENKLSSQPYSLDAAEAGFKSQSKIIGAYGELSIHCDFLQGQSTSEVNFTNFINCVRENNREGLINPFNEARKSNLLLQLTELSLKFERGFDFDPVQEKVVGDVEINNHL